MKIDIKRIVNSLSGEQKNEGAESRVVDIRKALGEQQKAPEVVEPAEPEQLESEAAAEPAPEEELDPAPEPEPEEGSDPAPEPAPEAAEPDDMPEAVPEAEPAEAPAQESAEAPAQESAEAPAQEPADDTESAEAPAQEPADDTEPAEAPEKADTEQLESEPPKMPPFRKENLTAWGRKYGWLTGIAASFVILIAFMIVYTTMTPRQINVEINGEELSFTTKEYTVEGFLEEENIALCEEDYLSIPLTAFIQDGLAFELKHATDFTVTADGDTKKYKTLDNTVKQALDDIGVKLNEKDIVKPSLDTMLEKDMKITVQRVIVAQEIEEEKIPFETIEKDDVTMNEGTSKVVTKGKDGKDKVTYEITYIDGKESSRKEIGRETVTAVVDEVIANGTRVNYNGKTYSKKLVVKAYAYTGGGTTAMGTRARVGEIAVDPSVIPLGTNVYIEGVGARRAEDTGGNIKGNTIDIYMNSQSACRNWGVRYVTIYIQ